MTPRKQKPKPRRRGSITKTATGGYLARVRLPPDPLTGKRGGASKSCETKADAEHWLADELARMDRGEVVGAGPTRRTLEAFLRDFYTRVRKTTRGSGVISERTAQVDLSLLDLYVFRRAPGLAQTALAQLTVPVLRDHFKALSESGLAKATVSRVARTLRARLAYAVAAGELRTNPMASPLISVAGKNKRARPILSGAQAGALFAVLPQSTVGTFLATLLWCGCRPGEGAGLLWDDVDLEHRVLRIRRALVRITPTAAQKGQGTSWTLGTTKTGTERVVPIPDALVAMLRRHRVEQAEAKLAAGHEYENSGLVFASTFGKPLHLDLIAARALRPLLREAAVRLAGMTPLPMPPATRAQAYTDAVAARRAQEDDAIKATAFPQGIGLYSLRHCYASRLASEGVPIKTIQELLGHSSIVTTLTSYVHTDADAARKGLEKLEAAFQPKAPRLGIA